MWWRQKYLKRSIEMQNLCSKNKKAPTVPNAKPAKFVVQQEQKTQNWKQIHICCYSELRIVRFWLLLLINKLKQSKIVNINNRKKKSKRKISATKELDIAPFFLGFFLNNLIILVLPNFGSVISNPRNSSTQRGGHS